MTNPGTTPITIVAVNSDHGLSFSEKRKTRTMVWVSFSLQIYSTFAFWRFKFSMVWVLVWVSSFYGDGGGSRTVKRKGKTLTKARTSLKNKEARKSCQDTCKPTCTLAAKASKVLCHSSHRNHYRNHYTSAVSQKIGAHNPPEKIHPKLRSRLPCTDPKSGLRPEMGKKWPKNGVWPHREKGEKMAEKWESGRFSYFFSPFFPFSPKSIFRPFFSPFLGPEARFGVCSGQSGSQTQSKEVHLNKFFWIISVGFLTCVKRRRQRFVQTFRKTIV